MAKLIAIMLILCISTSLVFSATMKFYKNNEITDYDQGG